MAKILNVAEVEYKDTGCNNDGVERGGKERKGDCLYSRAKA